MVAWLFRSSEVPLTAVHEASSFAKHGDRSRGLPRLPRRWHTPRELTAGFRMRPALVIKQSQQLTLTPQLRQSIRLLAMSALELQAEIQQALESNPFMEAMDYADPAEERLPDEGECGGEDPLEAATAEPATEVLDDELPSLEPEPVLGESGGSGGDEDWTAEQSAAETLKDHLGWQLQLTPWTQSDRAIAEAIVDAIDEDGYLRESDEEIKRAVAPDFLVESAEIDAVRHRIQRFDPLGVGSRSLAECLAVQLGESEHPERELALVLVQGHLEQLGRGDLARLSGALAVPTGRLEQAVALIRSLNPRPGEGYVVSREEVVIPDVYVKRQGRRYEVFLNPQCSPQVRLSGAYQRLMGRCRGDDAQYLKGQLQEARWLLKSLKQRDASVLRVARAIIEEQQDFLEYGPERMRPLVMRDIADRVGLHESTVSRIAARKYLHTPRGLYEFRWFFSSHVATRNGGEASAKAIQAMIRRLIDGEDTRKPLSDQHLADTLKSQGILVARRTVAKYREMLNIPPSSERVRLR